MAKPGLGACADCSAACARKRSKANGSSEFSALISAVLPETGLTGLDLIERNVADCRMDRVKVTARARFDYRSHARRQLAHASARFAAGDADRGTKSVIGAMYLLRAGEGRSEMITAPGERALAFAIEKLSALGDDGRALPFMQMRASFLPAGSQERAELLEHIDSLTAWMQAPRGGKPIRKIGDYDIKLKLPNDLEVTFKLTVLPEGE